MAVAFDAVSSDAAAAGNANAASGTRTWSHTCTGSNRALFVDATFGANNDDGNCAITGVTYNGVAMALAWAGAKVHSNNSAYGFVTLWVLVAPATGANNIVVSWTNGSADAADTVFGGGVSFTGVDQTTPNQNNTSAFGNSATPSVAVTSSAGNMTVDAMCCGTTQAINFVSTQTWRWDLRLGSANTQNGAQSTAAGAASVTMSYAIISDFWGIIGTDVKAAAAAAAYAPRPLIIQQAVNRAATY